eukprot:TRINITY_DN57996_c0_g1_i1.p1 TRINITY_DN57996_c0_g1~~TRINITY_DN57996_c0_g1_i1.p1  ORF type:complete len:273 (-),score=41.03 TRINITY_DN57996_c0_g1_i1:71-796(-)
MARPMVQFCCGCSLGFGAYVIIACNLVQSLFYIATATSNIILKIPTFGFHTSLISQTVNASICLIGLPFIAGAIWGVRNRLETNLRLYLVYLAFVFAIDLGHILYDIVLNDPCTSMPPVVARHGAAFACGFMRIGTAVFLLAMLSLQFYCVFTIWSLCEDIKVAGGSGLPELLRDAQAAHSKLRYSAPQYEEGGLFGAHGVGGGTFPVAYGAVSGPGVGGGTRIFQGNFHDTTYPPVHVMN